MPWLTTRRLVAAAIAGWLVAAAIGLAIGPPLGHDEAAFAIVARGDHPMGAWLYRSDGMVAIARLGVALGAADWQLRLASAALGAAIVVAAFAVGRAAFTARTGAWAAALVAGAHPMALRSAHLLGDLPAAAAILGGVAVLAGELERAAGRATGPRWRIVAAAPLFAAAFYLRYGSAPVIAIALAAAALMWWRTIAARPLPALAAVAVLAALLLPHLVRSALATGSPLGILAISAGMPRRAYLGEGLVTYLTSNPLQFYGVLIAPVMLAGVLGLIQTRRRAPWFLAIVALGQLVALGLNNHGQSRYVLVAAVLLAVTGVDTLARIGRPGVALAMVAAAWLGTIVTEVVVCRGATRIRAPIVRAADAVRADAAGRRCAVVAAMVPQVAWYSRCEVYLSRLLDAPMPAGRVRYAVATAHRPIERSEMGGGDPAGFAGGAGGKAPRGIELDRAVAVHHARAVPLPTGDPDAQVWRLE